MALAYTVALVGFSQEESVTFESFFRLAARRPPGYTVQDEVMDAQILLVNADNPQALHLVEYAELPGKVLLIGQNDGGTGWPLQRKPVKLVQVLAALDSITGVRRAPPAPAAPRARPPAPVVPAPAFDGFAATQPFEGSALQALDASRRAAEAAAAAKAASAPMTPARRRDAGESEFPATRPMRRQAEAVKTAPASPSPMPPRAAPASATNRASLPTAAEARHLAKPGVVRLTDFGGLDELPVPASIAPSSRGRGEARSTRSRAPAVPEVRRGDVLLVAESLVEGRILHKRFARYGLTIDWSRESPQALVMLKAHAYRLVVIDRLSGEPDAFQVCRQAKQRKLPNGQSPVVLMFTPSLGSMDRIKAGLAGCDGYYPRSVPEAELYRTLAQHRLVSLDGFEPTNAAF